MNGIKINQSRPKKNNTALYVFGQCFPIRVLVSLHARVHWNNNNVIAEYIDVSDINLIPNARALIYDAQ